ncbi:MAG: T9SS type A sorting domain-containing protein [Saprospiraceae bacterium]|nr:T9SS type A sorting domain-containing protein [Saprospiraceae bacterium]
MKKILLMALLLLGFISTNAQVVYEDFEGGTADLAWIGLNGAYNGAIVNPDQSGANTSGWVGSYTNAPAFDFCFALYTFPSTLDISEFNQFKMKIWSPVAPCQALLKLEGPGGPAVEKFVDITVANQWVEYTFDLSAGAGYTNLKTILVSFNPFVLGDNQTYYFDDIRAEKAQVCYADFEGPGLNFQGLDGVLTAPEPNPGANSINSSDNCAKYIKSNQHAYSLILADNGTPFDLSVYNQFKMDVFATAPTQVLFKLEGTGGGFEVIKNIAVTGAWQTYTFDFSAQAANTGLSKIVVFFDPGVETSGDTYYFDNVCAVPNPCPNVTPDPEILDDYECQRRATYAGDWSFLSVVTNPVPTGDNNSAKVGRFDDPSGPGTEWSNMQIDFENPIDLTERNEFSCQVYAPKAGNLLLKIEGGPNPAMEVAFPVTELNKWVTYTVDFSSQIGKGHRKFVIFFNAGVNGEPGDVYYIDNIKLAAPAALPPLEDFQDGIHLGWQALDQNEPIHGVFQGPVNNPAPGGVNTSTQVGCYTKGSSPFSTLQAFSLTNFDLSVYSQFNLDVLSPAGVGGTVTFILNSPTQGNKEAEAEITTPGEWETLSFDFSAFSDITDFAEVRVIFNAGTAAQGQIWYYDNLLQSETTVDPCADVVPVPNIIDDFECQRNYTQIFYGASDLQVVNNPHLTPENGSLKVGQYTDPGGAGTEFAGIGIEFPAPPDLSVYNHLSMQVWAPFDNVPFLFKLEGSGQGVEIFDTLPQGNTWYKFDIDFSGAVGTQHNKLVIFANVLSPTGGGTYFYDNIRWARANYSGCIIDHQTAPSTVNFKYFANGHLEAEGYQFEVVDNPNPTGINTSNRVGKFVKASDGAPFAGMYSDPNLESPIDFRGVKTVRAKVHMDHIGNFAVKLEGSSTGAPAFEIPVPNTQVNAWEELTFDFSVVPDNGEYRRLTLFFDLGIDATGVDVTSYFDDIVIGEGNCSTVGVFSPADVAAMRLMPNPAADYLLVENLDGVTRLEVYDLFGRRVALLNTSGDTATDLNVSNFPAGMYHLSGFDRNGTLIGKAKFVKK